MTTQTIHDYINKQLSIEKNIVTFRSLSRQFSFNVHVAHNELAAFLESTSHNAVATFLVSGERQPLGFRFNEGSGMDENEKYEDDAEGEQALQFASVLTVEANLQATQASFRTVESTLVYSLSHSLPRDSGLLCSPTPGIRAIDAKKEADFSKLVGQVISSHVVKSDKPLPAWGGRKSAPPVAGPSKTTTAPVKTEKKEAKPKPTGKLDFSKAKIKDEEKPVKVEFTPKATISEKVRAKMEDSKKRGTKRKSALASDSEEEEVIISEPKKVTEKPQPSLKAEASVRIRKGVVLSDDDDDDPSPPVDRKGKNKAIITQEEKDLHALMDIDDEAITRVSRKEPESESKTASADEDVEMSDVEEKPAAPPKRERKPKKVIPVGRNGLKKKRVVKSKMSFDAKGYTVMEDYSEYESVEEEEEDNSPPPKAKAKGKEKVDAPTPKAKSTTPAPTKPKPKPSGGSSKGAQKGIANFFGKK
ncbi:DNA polymerase subunit Cdc27 [Mycena indigotica]|uniref:DNA polymerase delta subunit 3 n=1 Tax=Mycena indigotica TaxID=2126181 RepID=A0A8H6T3K1_9AGAR|nr:DNA polymerase subunit Cdc27 [Mycena indigotica]KAF7309712.1 DNA polymerase subunit Cdc27 [Mycena indigotica]